MRYKLLFQKKRFDIGYSMLGMIKYAVVAYLLVDYTIGILSSIVYGLICYVIGTLWYRPISGATMMEIEYEFGNQYNKFVKEMRATHKDGNNR